MKRSLRHKVRALGLLQVLVVAGIMAVLGVLFFQKIVSDEDTFVAGTRKVKREDAEGVAKLLALELGRLDALRYARSGLRADLTNHVRAILWEKVTFIRGLQELDLVARVLDGTTSGRAFCLRPLGRDATCNDIGDFDALWERHATIHRLERLREGAYAMPLFVGGAFFGVVRFEMSTSTVTETLRGLVARNRQDKVTFIILFIVCVAAAAGLSLLVLGAVFRRMHRPLITLTQNAVALGERPDAPVARVDADPEDEIGVLAQRFEEMQARLSESFLALEKSLAETERAMREKEEKDELLRRSERLASVGVLAAGVAHEIGNKLNPMAFVVHNLRKRIEKGKPPDVEQLEVLSRAIDSTAVIVERLRALARPERSAADGPVALNEVARDVVMLLTAQTQSLGVALQHELTADLPPILGIHGDLVQVLINLVVNARDAIDARADVRGAGRIVVRTALDAGRVVLEVEDNGSGMTEEVKARVFEPFFTTRGLATGGGSGTGLGLYICHGILARHGVEPELVTAPGIGTRVIMRFPAATQPPGGIQEPKSTIGSGPPEKSTDR